MVECIVERDPARFVARVTPFLSSQLVANYLPIVMLQPWIDGIGTDLELLGAYARDEAGDVAGVAVQVHAPGTVRLALSPMPPDAVAALEEPLGEVAGAYRVSGPPGPTRAFVERRSRRTGRPYKTGTAMRMYVLREVPPPLAIPGSARVAGAEDAALVEDWLAAYIADVTARTGGQHPPLLRADQFRRGGGLLLWEVDGTPVALMGYLMLPWGAATIVPGYTPPQYRGSGYAMALFREAVLAAMGRGADLILDTADPDYLPVNAAVTELGFERAGEDWQHYTFPPRP